VVDPAKEANAQKIRLANHTTTLAHEYARQGRDWEAELKQRAKEISLMHELGLSTDSTSLSPGEVTDDEDIAVEQAE
jgi:capsid protein